MLSLKSVMMVVYITLLLHLYPLYCDYFVGDALSVANPYQIDVKFSRSIAFNLFDFAFNRLFHLHFATALRFMF